MGRCLRQRMAVKSQYRLVLTGLIKGKLLIVGAGAALSVRSAFGCCRVSGKVVAFAGI